MTSNGTDKARVNGIHANNASDGKAGFDNLGVITEDEGPVHEKLDNVELNKISSARTSVSWSEDVKTVRFETLSALLSVKGVHMKCINQIR